MSDRHAFPSGNVPLNIVTRHVPEDTFLCGALWTRRGWYWWFEAIDPTGNALCGCMKGPFDSEGLALTAAADQRGPL